jgi:signal peptidase II
MTSGDMPPRDRPAATDRSQDAAVPSGRRRTGLALLVAGTVVVLDQVSKFVALRALTPGEQVPLLGDVLHLRLTFNPGAAFSLGTGYTVLLSLVAAAVVVAVLRLSRRLRSIGWAVALGGLLGGALGNLTDRLVRQPGPLRGHVVDFLELPRWPIFNVADSAIVGAAVLMVLLSLRGVEYDGRRP